MTERRVMDWDQIEQAAAHYREGATDADCARLDFFQGLWRLQEERSRMLAVAVPYDAPDAAHVQTWYWDSAPVLSHAPVSVASDQFAETCGSIAGYLATHAGIDSAAARALELVDWRRLAHESDLHLAGGDPAVFVGKTLSSLDALGVGANVRASLVAMVLNSSVRAHVQEAARVCLEAADPVAHRKGHDMPLACPICGAPAVLSIVGPAAGTDGKGRLAYCGLCGARWPFERIRCGVCGERNPSKLRYRHIDGDSAHRLHVCDTCGGYQRVVFEEELPLSTALEVEDVVMARLDQLARQDGIA